MGLIAPFQADKETPRCGSLHRGEQCRHDHDHGPGETGNHESLNHAWPMHLPLGWKP